MSYLDDRIQLNIEVPGVRMHVLDHLRKRHVDIEGRVEAAVDEALRHFDVQAVVTSELDRALREAIKSAIGNAVSRLRYSEEFAREVDGLVRRSLGRATSGDGT